MIPSRATTTDRTEAVHDALCRVRMIICSAELTPGAKARLLTHEIRDVRRWTPDAIGLRTMGQRAVLRLLALPELTAADWDPGAPLAWECERVAADVDTMLASGAITSHLPGGSAS